MGLISTKLCVLVLVPLLFTALIPIIDPAYGQESEFLNRSVFAWSLFYQLMTAVFIVGALVQGTIVFIIIRFREKAKHEEVSR